MFCDETTIQLKAGNGGNGCVSFLSIRAMSKGGPDGGNGGQGGNISFQANENLNSLIHLHSKKKFKAEHGINGSSKNCTGRSGENLILEVPIGTQIFDADNNEKLADLTQHKSLFVAARGGRGGYGNAHFTSSTRQAPRFAELGEPGEIQNVRLELKLVADIGIIGLPSAGKSTLISVLSDARPKIGAFPFTTLIPNLGVAKIDNNSLVFCDIPGLIEGAHQGKGLGDKFLRHIARNRVLLHLISTESENPKKDVQIITAELKKFNPALAKIPSLLVISKADLADEQKIAEIQKLFPKQETLVVSAATHQGIPNLLHRSFELLQAEKAKIQAQEKPKDEQIIFRPHLEEKNSKRFEIEKISPDSFRVIGPRIEQIAIMTNYQSWEAVARLRDVMRKIGVEKELLKMKAERGNQIFFGHQEKSLEFLPQLSKN